MIEMPADFIGETPHSFHSSREIGPQLGLPFSGEEGLPVFRAENEMHVDLCEGLSHASIFSFCVRLSRTFSAHSFRRNEPGPSLTWFAVARAGMSRPFRPCFCLLQYLATICLQSGVVFYAYTFLAK